MTNGLPHQNTAVDTTPHNGPQSYLLISRMVDFWLLGGLSIALWIPVYFLQDQLSLAKSLTMAIPGISLTLAYWVNYPHFMASYKLAYTQGKGFVVQNWFQLLLVPIALVLLIAISFGFWNSSISDSSLVHIANTSFSWLGLKTRLGQYPNLGSEIMGLMIVFLYFTVGWHYSKQTFGCMMVYAKLDNYRLNTLERNTIRYALLSTWWVSWLYSNCAEGTYPFYGLNIHRLNLPYVWFQASYFIVSTLFIAVAVIFFIKYYRDKQSPSWNFLVPMLALLIWHIPIMGNPQFFYLLAFFHSLQYFPFVAKVEKTRYRVNHRPKQTVRLLAFFAIMMLLGYLSFDLAPHQLDQSLQSRNLFNVSFFMIAFLSFINIHHYFIDNVLWRFKSKDVKQLLFD